MCLSWQTPLSGLLLEVRGSESTHQEEGPASLKKPVRLHHFTASHLVRTLRMTELPINPPGKNSMRKEHQTRRHAVQVACSRCTSSRPARRPLHPSPIRDVMLLGAQRGTAGSGSGARSGPNRQRGIPQGWNCLAAHPVREWTARPRSLCTRERLLKVSAWSYPAPRCRKFSRCLLELTLDLMFAWF